MATLSGQGVLDRLGVHLDDEEGIEVGELTPDEERVAQKAKRPSYAVANLRLFRRRKELLGQIEALSVAGGRYETSEETRTRQRQLRRLRDELEQVTAEIARFNEGLVHSVARKFSSNTNGEDTKDFYGAGWVGLMEAISTFDPDKGVWSQWALIHIRRQAQRAMHRIEYDHLTNPELEKRPAILAARDELRGPDGDYEPTVEEVAARAGVEKVEQVYYVLNPPSVGSLQAPIGDETGDGELVDLLEDNSEGVEDTVLTSLDIESLYRYGLPELTHRERLVLVRYYGLDDQPSMILQTIGDQLLGLSREAVRNILEKARAKLLHPVVLRRVVYQGRET